MTTNLLLPNSAEDIAGALYDEASDADPTWRAAVVRRLAQELKTNPEHSVPIGALPRFAEHLEWARETCQLLPAARVRGEVSVVAAAARRATKLLPRLRKRNPALAGSSDDLLSSFDSERWPALVARASGLSEALLDWSEADRRARAYRRRLREERAVPGAEGRIWRSVGAYAQLLERGRGAQWCIVRDDYLRQSYFNRFRRGALSFWTLHDGDGRTLALLSVQADGDLDSVRNMRNRAAPEFRADIKSFARREGVKLSGYDADELAFDDHLGKRGQPFYEGVLTGRRCAQPIRYRLWCDGRRRRYLLATGTDPKRTPKTFLRLDASVKGDEDGLTGAAHEAWTGSTAALMIAALADVFPAGDRPAHVRRAMRTARPHHG